MNTNYIQALRATQEVKFWEMTIQGSLPVHKKSELSRWGCVDIGGLSYGRFIIKGTEDELNEFWDILGTDNTYYKVIGVTSFPVAGYEVGKKLIIEKKNFEQYKRAV